MSVWALFRVCAANSYKVLFISVDLPEPETPVIQVRTPTGIDRSTFFKLLPLAPEIVNQPDAFFLSFGVEISCRPLK